MASECRLNGNRSTPGEAEPLCAREPAHGPTTTRRPGALDRVPGSGRLVHRLGPLSQAAGSVEMRWDGRDANGSLLPPGHYLYRLEVTSDKSADERVGTLSIVY